MVESLSREERERILRAIEEDREFRYALMGLLGYREVLDRIVKLEERFAELTERVTRLEERMVKLEERFTQLEERFAKLEERFVELAERVSRLEERIAKLEERFAQLEERVIRLEERFAQLEERVIKLEERVLRVEEELRDSRRLMAIIAHRFGVISEEALRSSLKYVIEEVFGVAKVERWVYRDEEGTVYGYPAVVEVDVVIKDREHVLVEMKSRVSKADVAELYRVGRLYERVHGIRPRLVVVGGLIEEGAQELAASLGVEVRPAVRF